VKSLIKPKSVCGVNEVPVDRNGANRLHSEVLLEAVTVAY